MRASSSCSRQGCLVFGGLVMLQQARLSGIRVEGQAVQGINQGPVISCRPILHRLMPAAGKPGIGLPAQVEVWRLEPLIKA